MEPEDGAIVLAPGEGRRVTLGPADVVFKVTKEDTSGNFAFCEYTAAAGFAGPLPHIHWDHEEVFYVLEGNIDIKIGEHTVEAGAGTFAMVPRGSAHTFSNPGDSPAKLLGMFSPAGYEGYFEELRTMLESDPAASREAVGELMGRYQTELADDPPPDN